jgi:hypothetical protein
MVMRRAVVLLIALLTEGGLAWLLWQVLAPGGWTTAKLVMAAAFAGTAPWTGSCAANGVIGSCCSRQGAVLLPCRKREARGRLLSPVICARQPRSS